MKVVCGVRLSVDYVFVRLSLSVCLSARLSFNVVFRPCLTLLNQSLPSSFVSVRNPVPLVAVAAAHVPPLDVFPFS